MVDLFFQIALSNVGISLALAVVAVVVGITLKRPALAHLLWLLVIVKLLTPSLVTIPIVTIPRQANSAPAAIFAIDEQQDAAAVQVAGSEKAAFFSAKTWSTVLNFVKPWLFLIWMLGSLFVFVWTLLRIYRFSRLLGKETEVGSPELQAAATKIASRFGLRATPTIYTTTAHLSPMVCWMGGEVWIVIPDALLDQMDTMEFQWILAHELAHVRRRDYMVRWIEWLACVCFWWNPVVWWARYNLRANEELCCDARVLSSLKPKPHIYGNSLLKAVEILAFPAFRLPAMASEINSGGLLERRVTMLVSTNLKQSNPRWMLACVLLLAVAILPLGLAIAGEETNGSKLLASERSETELRMEINEQSKHKSKSESAYNKIGFSSDMFDRLQMALYKRGIKREQLDEAMIGMLKVIYEMKSEGKEFEMDSRLQDYLQNEIELTDEQVELVQGLARRAVSGLSDTDPSKRLMNYLFEQVELDKSESLSLSEIKTALNAGNERFAILLTRLQLQESFKRIDLNSDRELSKKECYRIIKANE